MCREFNVIASTLREISPFINCNMLLIRDLKLPHTYLSTKN